MTTTWFEQGLEQGLEQGREVGREEGSEQGQRKLLAALLEGRFGPLTPEVRKRLENCSADQLTDLGLRLLTAQSLTALGLEEDGDGPAVS
ncbi:MAG: DUF4351 domain-containing protein [Planctomycetaceae bacterium]